MKLIVLTKENCEQVRLWRNESLVALRTPYMLTQEQQEDFYKNVVCNRDARARYWGIYISEVARLGPDGNTYCEDGLIGMVGLENINDIAHRAEISIMIDPNYQKAGYGRQALDLLLDKGFGELNLETIDGEVYTCNPQWGFWKKMCYEYCGRFPETPTKLKTKYWYGWHHSYIFEFYREEYYNAKTNKGL